jgi:WD40 repeat protein
LRDAQDARDRIQERELSLRRHLYAYDFKAIQDLWARGRTARVRELLEAQRPQPGQEQIRSFEWYHYWLLAHGGARTLRTRGCEWVAFSPDGKMLATGGKEEVCLWDAASGTLRQTWKRGVSALAFSPDGKSLAAGAGAVATLWDVTTFEQRWSGQEDGTIVALAFPPADSSHLAIARNVFKPSGKTASEVKLWDVGSQTARSLFREPAFGIYGLVFSPDGKSLAVSSLEQTVLLDARTGRPQRSVDGGGSGLAFSPDSRLLALLQFGQGDPFRLVDPLTGSVQATLSGGPQVSSNDPLAFAPKGQALARRVDNDLCLWDAATRKEIGLFRGHVRRITSIAFSPDGMRVATGSDPPAGRDQPGEVRLWDVSDPNPGLDSLPLRTLDIQPQALAFAPGNKSLIVRGRKTSQTWGEPPPNLEPEMQFESKQTPIRHHTLSLKYANSSRDTVALSYESLNLRRVAYEPDGKVLATVGWRTEKAIYLNDPSDGHLLKTLTPKVVAYAVAFSPDGHTLAVIGLDRTISLWDVGSWTERTVLHGHQRFIAALAFAADGRALATASIDGTVKLWDVAAGRERATLPHPRRLDSLLFAPDGKTLLTGWYEANGPGFVKLWDAATGRGNGMIADCSPGSERAVFSPDCQLLAIPYGDRARGKYGVLVCNGITGQRLSSLAGHRSWVRCLAFAPDGKTLAAASDGEPVKLWDVSRAPELSPPLPTPFQVACLTFTSDGKTLVAGCLDYTVRLWDWQSSRKQAVLGEADRSKGVYQLVFSPDGRTLATMGLNGPDIKLWDVGAGKELARLRVTSGMFVIKPLLFAPNGRTLVMDSMDSVLLWETATGTQKAVVRPTSESRSEANVVASTADGQTVLTWGPFPNPQAKLWDAVTGRERATLVGFHYPINSADFSPDGQLLATLHGDGSVRLWDAATGQFLRSEQSESGYAVEALAFSPDSRILAKARRNKSIDLWDLASGIAVTPLFGADKTRLLAFAPDGRLLAAAENDGTVRLWDLVTGQEQTHLLGLEGQVSAMAIAPDGRTLAVCQENGLKLWDTATGRERVTLWEITQPQFVAFFPEGTTLAAADHQELRLWYAATEQEVAAWGR